MNFISIEDHNKARTLWLNRPEVRNAFNDEMIDELTKAFLDASQDESLRVLVIRGRGESFCAGADLNWMKSMVNFSHEENKLDSEKLYEMFAALKNVPMPVVCQVHGHAMGGALGLIAASDIVIAESQTQFCFSEVRLGLAPAVISAFVRDKVRPSDMNRYFLTAELFSAEKALAMGLVHEVGAGDDAESIMSQVLRKLTSNGPNAVRATKEMINQLNDAEDMKSLTTEVIASLRVSPEGQEGLKAFFEKRKPNWLEATDA